MTNMLSIKIALSLLAILGLGISLGEMLGRLRDNDRVNFAKIMGTDLECPKEHPGARKFIDGFLYGNPEYKDMLIDEAEIEKVVFVGLWIGSPNDETGRNVDGVTAGTIKLKAFGGQVTKSLCSFEELKTWSKEAPLWKWLGWGIVAVSVILIIVLLVIEEMLKGKHSI